MLRQRSGLPAVPQLVLLWSCTGTTGTNLNGIKGLPHPIPLTINRVCTFDAAMAEIKLRAMYEHPQQNTRIPT